jgi:hypothetical protein
MFNITIVTLPPTLPNKSVDLLRKAGVQTIKDCGVTVVLHSSSRTQVRFYVLTRGEDKEARDQGKHMEVLQWCYSGVTMVSRWCYSDVTVVSQWCYSCVAVVSE